MVFRTNRIMPLRTPTATDRFRRVPNRKPSVLDCLCRLRCGLSKKSVGDVSGTTVRAVVVQADGEGVLVTASGLPQIVMSDVSFTDVEAPLREFHDQLGIDGYVLICLEDDQAADRIDYLLINTGTPAGEWRTVLDDPLVKAARIHLGLPANQPATPAWTKPGWYAEALAWIDEQLDAAGSPRTGVPVQVRSWGLSNVLRCPTAAGDVYFKAVAHSSTITAARGTRLLCCLRTNLGCCGICPTGDPARWSLRWRSTRTGSGCCCRISVRR